MEQGAGSGAFSWSPHPSQQDFCALAADGALAAMAGAAKSASSASKTIIDVMHWTVFRMTYNIGVRKIDGQGNTGEAILPATVKIFVSPPPPAPQRVYENLPPSGLLTSAQSLNYLYFP